MDSQLVSERPSEAVGEKRASNGTDTAHRANGVKVTAKETDKLSPPSKNGSDGELDEDKNMGFAVYLKRHWHAVITYCAVFWSFGMCVAFLGPTLLDLGCMTSSDMKSISWVFFAQLLCSLLGASGAGYMVERGFISTATNTSEKCDANYIILVATIIIPVSMMLIPFCKMLTGLAIVLAVMGINMGIIDCLANIQMIKIFGDAVPPFLQAMHFCYGFGAFVSPMIAEPFLLNEDCSPFIDNTTVASAPAGLSEPTMQEAENDSSLPAHSLSEAQTMTRVHYAFWIMAATQIPIPFMVLSLVIRRKVRGISHKHQQLADSDTSPSETHHPAANNQYGAILNSEKEPLDKTEKSSKWFSQSRHVIGITVTTAAMLFIYDGLQSAYGGYVYSYAVKSIADLNTTEGAYLNALFWGMFAFGRLVSIPLATRFSPACMLICNMVGSLFAMTLMLSLRHDHKALYVGTCLFGLFLSSVAPTVISLAEQYIYLSSTVTSIVVVVGAVGEMICPVIVGNIFVVLGPVSFLCFGEIMCLVSLFVFLALWLIGRTSPKHLAKSPKGPVSSVIWCHMCCVKPPPEPHHATTQHVQYHHQMSTESSGTIEMTNVKKEADRVNLANHYDQENNFLS